MNSQKKENPKPEIVKDSKAVSNKEGGFDFQSDGCAKKLFVILLVLFLGYVLFYFFALIAMTHQG